MIRELSAAAVLVLALSACSSDDEDSTQPATSEAASATTGAATATDAESTTTQTFTPVTEVFVETPFSLPPLDTDDIDVMIEEAFEDDVIEAAEIAGILESAGLSAEIAACEADLLFELGVEDVGGGLELQQAVEAMTPEQAERLEECLDS